MQCNCDNIITYKKAIPSENIEIGDLIMLDPDTSFIKRACYENPEDIMINSRLIVGVCVNSNNSSPDVDIIDGGSSLKSLDEFKELFNGGSSENVETIMIVGGGADQEAKSIIQVAYSGEQLVNICGYVDLGDKLCFSKHPGKAKSKDYIDEEYFNFRSIGKVIKFTNNKEQVKVLLDIE